MHEFFCVFLTRLMVASFYTDKYAWDIFSFTHFETLKFHSLLKDKIRLKVLLGGVVHAATRVWTCTTSGPKRADIWTPNTLTGPDPTFPTPTSAFPDASQPDPA